MGDAYVLQALDERELERLRDQHDVWRSVTDRVLARSGFSAGHHLADIGCGPGSLTIELAGLVGPLGSVRAIDRSPRFIEALVDEVSARGLDPRLVPEVGDARDLGGETASLDGAICRWVLMFLSDPARLVERVARLLRPGGTFVAMEYAHFRTISLWPQGAGFRRVHDAVFEHITASGGDPDVGARVPALATEAGLTVQEVLPFWRLGRPGSPLWRWLSSVHANHRQLVEDHLLSEGELLAFHEEWARAEGDASAFFTAPPLLATIARKP